MGFYGGSLRAVGGGIGRLNHPVVRISYPKATVLRGGSGSEMLLNRVEMAAHSAWR
jgi:hypothetical protein